MVYSIEWHAFLVERFYQATSVIMIRHEFGMKFECRKAPSMPAVNRLGNKFEMSGSMIDSKKGIVSKMTVRTPENIHLVEQALTQSSRKSVRLLSQQLNVRASSTYRIIGEDVKLFLYKIQMKQTLHLTDKVRRDFKMFLEYNPAVPQSIWFSDGGHFNLNGYMNK
jgi:hypothetical protein